jgi:KUP system potassium uptake protein
MAFTAILGKLLLLALLLLLHAAGGTFAMYSILCRSLGITPLGAELSDADKGLSRYSCAPNQEINAGQPSTSESQGAKRGPTRSSWNSSVRMAFKEKGGLQMALLVVVVLGTAMVVGDGILTPAISVLSAVGGLNVAQVVDVTQGVFGASLGKGRVIRMGTKAYC